LYAGVQVEALSAHSSMLRETVGELNAAVVAVGIFTKSSRFGSPLCATVKRCTEITFEKDSHYENHSKQTFRRECLNELFFLFRACNHSRK